MLEATYIFDTLIYFMISNETQYAVTSAGQPIKILMIFATNLIAFVLTQHTRLLFSNIKKKIVSNKKKHTRLVRFHEYGRRVLGGFCA